MEMEMEKEKNNNLTSWYIQAVYDELENRGFERL